MSSMTGTAPRVEEPPHVELAGHYIAAAIRVAPTNQPRVFTNYLNAAARQFGLAK